MNHGHNIPPPAEYICLVARERLFKRNQALTLDITDVGFGGKGIARIETEKGPFVVFVQNTIPGQRVLARVEKCKSRHAECKLEEIIQRSELEKDNGFQTIPGAPYANLPIGEQQRIKEKTAFDLYRKIGGVEHLESLYHGFISSPSVWHYRNKMEYSFSAILHNTDSGEKEDDFALGFKRRGTWWAVENLDNDSGLFDSDVETALKSLRAWLASTGLPPWHPPQRVGFFRFLTVRKSRANGGLLFNLVTSSDGIEAFDREGFVAWLCNQFGERLVGVLHTINDDRGERVEARAGTSELIFGENHITETLHGLDFQIEMASFFQTNPACAERLYEAAVNAVVQLSQKKNSNPNSVILDLFCGTGTIAQLIAKQINQRVIGVEIVPQAIEDAKRSAVRNKIDNVEFYAADVGKFLLERPEFQGQIEVIVLDPPRAGISPKSLRKVIRLGAKSIVYVSCNPATQARDIQVLREWGYELISLQLVDQFPHTAHVEAIGIFELNGESPKFPQK